MEGGGGGAPDVGYGQAQRVGHKAGTTLKAPGGGGGSGQGLTLVHFSAQLERSLWDRGCA